MAERTPSSFTPWYDTLKGISKSGTSPSIEGAPGRRSYSSKVGPLDVRALRTTADSEPYSTDLSSFSFSRSVNFGPIPGSPAPKTFDKEPAVPRSPAPKTFDKKPAVPRSPAPKTFDKEPAVQPKKEELRQLPSIQTRSAPPARPLSPPPGSPREKVGDPRGDSSDVPAPKAIQYQVGQDFAYHPKSEDSFYPSVKYDLGPEKKSSRVKRCCCWTLFFILVALMGLGIGVGVVIVELKPKTPSLSIGKVAVTSLQFIPSTESSGASQLAIGVDFPFNLTNPNKHAKVMYNQISVSVYFQELFLGSTNAIPAFVQETRNTNSFTTNLPRNVTNVPADAVDSLQGEVQKSDVQVDLAGSVQGGYKMLGHKIESFSIPIACHLTLNPNASGNQATIVDNSCVQN